jgi:hypothetical protein
LRNRRTTNGLHAAKSNAGRNAILDEDSKPHPIISTDITFQDDATRLTNNGDDTSKRKARSIQMHTGSEQPTTKRPKNKQDRPTRNDTKVNSLNDEDRKPAAKKTTPTPDGAPSTCASFKRKRTQTCSNSVVSTSGQGVQREPTPNTKTVPVPTNTSIRQAEASIPTETVINGSNLNCTVTVRRKAAKRTDPLYLAPPPPNITAQLPPSLMPQAEDISARKKPCVEDIPVTQEPRVEEPLPTATDETA